MSWWLHGGRIVDPETGTDRVGDLFIADGSIVDPQGAPDGFRRIDCAGMVVAPGFVDLHAAMPDPGLESVAAVAGGFTTVVTSPANHHAVDRPALVRDLLARAVKAKCRVEVAGALTAALEGKEIADVGLLAAAGCRVLSNGTTPVRNARILRHLLEYAGRFKLPIHLRAVDAELEAGGIVREGPRAAWLGLPHVPPEAEEIGVVTVAALVRRTGVPVHLTHLWTAKGIEALRRAQAESLPITGSTTIASLALDDGILSETDYLGSCRFVPPLGDAADRRALLDALADGTIGAVATDHRPLALHLQDRELELAAPGQVGFEFAFPLVLAACGDLAATIAALSCGPARLLGERAALDPGSRADVVVLDPTSSWTVSAELLRSTHTNTPLVGRKMTGAVGLVFVGGKLVYEGAST